MLVDMEISVANLEEEFDDEVSDCCGPGCCMESLHDEAE